MIGVDLGATHSRIAVMEGASPRVIPNLDGARATPTLVAFGEDGEPRVGEAARRQAIQDPRASVVAVLRLLGRTLEARTAKERGRWARARLAAAANGDLRVIVAGEALSPPEIAAHLLGHLKAAAEHQLGETVDEAVIAVPSSFDDLQRQATRDAGLIAGLRVARLVNRSTAAALGLGLESRDRRNVAICDFSAGSFDVSILELDDGWVQVRATAGTPEEPGEALLESAAALGRRCLADARLAPGQVDEALLLGSQAPMGVSDMVQRVFGKPPGLRTDLDESVVLGAAIQSAILQGEMSDLVLLDVTPHTLGIETKDGTFTPVIERNTTIPTRKRRVFTTITDNQTRVLVHVLQGESDMAAYNKSLAKFELTNIPPSPKGVPQIEVSFEIDVNGIVSVSAQDQATGRSQSVVIHPSGGLSQSELSRLVNETRMRDQSERSRKEQESVARQLDGLVANTMRSVQALEGKLTSDEQERILGAMERAKKSRADGDLDELKARLVDMEKAASLIGQAMLRP
jgi:molecular chaperone DnaK (HSP70)